MMLHLFYKILITVIADKASFLIGRKKQTIHQKPYYYSKLKLNTSISVNYFNIQHHYITE
jgi:hypothetical protein